MKKIKNKLLRILLIMLIIIFAFYIRVNAFTIVLDPGHGGSDSGAINARVNLKESEINYKIASYLASYLNRYQNVDVIMTRTSTQNKSLQQRADVAITNNADLLMSLHINSAESGTPTGACTYVTYRTDFDKYKKNCTALSNLILKNLSKIGIKNNGVKTRVCKDNEPKWMYADGTHADYYGIIRYCMKGTKGDGIENEIDISSGKSIPVVLLEHCYIKNGDEKYINSNADIQRIAKCDLDGIVSYYGLKLKEQETINLKNTTVKIDISDKKYTGKSISTSISIKDSSYQLIDGIDYIVSYRNNKNTGKATVTVNGIGFYKGSISKTFNIVPAKASISSVKNVSKKSAKVTWKKDTQASGYEIYMSTAKADKTYMQTTSKLTLRKSTSTSSKSLLKIPRGAKIKVLKKNVKKSRGYTWYKVSYKGKTGYVAIKYLETIYNEGKYSKIKTITSNKTTIYTKTKLSKGKKYTFKIRNYKVIDGKKYYGSYSSAKWVTIKK